MERIFREKIGYVSSFVCLILIVTYITGGRGQETYGTITMPDEAITRAPGGFMFNMDRKPGRVHRIINGGIATPHAYPFQVALHVTRGGKLFLCGGTLVTKNWILTAAHCVDTASSILVILGAHSLERAEATMRVINSTTFIKHESYNARALRNDIGLVHVKKKIPINNFIQFVRLATSSQTYEGVTARCLGWGTTILGSTSNVLRYVDLDIMSVSKCKSYRDFTAYVTNKHICTTGEGFVGSCQGDSGGPLVLNGFQIGVVSFGSTNCQNGLPSAFTRVDQYIDWIVGKTGVDIHQRSTGYACKMEVYMKRIMLCLTFLRFL